MTTPQRQFAERCAAVAAELALAFAGQPDEKVARSLEQMSANLRIKLTKEFSAAVDVPRVVALFVDAVMARKREIEAATLGPHALN
jgi:hypothetical protein